MINNKFKKILELLGDIELSYPIVIPNIKKKKKCHKPKK